MIVLFYLENLQAFYKGKSGYFRASKQQTIIVRTNLRPFASIGRPRLRYEAWEIVSDANTKY